ncbi:hypothetical protein EDD66_10830 [Mobilisporobacter senegalensis]|uniref:Uncharacterized protein n=1 Tax=Mobilisporobacter senegalensis TaxID=1329262 RepID=A0A3N1XJN6_9FIRM|nr:DUF6106 family protein [Mobilisporobacter senegalensis]ROR26308.1 hypothetical protein EDD66_10830 [Mobilisporobacter senegalensis]
MSELYAEAGVKRRENAKSIAARVGMIAFIIVSFFISGLSTFLVVLPAAALIIAFIFFPRLSVEYEYVFCDGQIDFDKIMGKAKRKTMLKMDLDQIEIVAPTNSHSLDSYKNSNLPKKNYSSLDSNARTYTIIGRVKNKTEGQNIQVIFEPSEKMIECMKLKSPRKVVTY